MSQYLDVECHQAHLTLYLYCSRRVNSFYLYDEEFLDGTRHVIYPWNQSKI